MLRGVDWRCVVFLCGYGWVGSGIEFIVMIIKKG
jgi:hypothetical protein